MFSVLIPWRPHNAHRERLRVWVEQRWRLRFPDAQLCYGQGPAVGPFNRSAALNEAFRAARHDILVIADADTVFDEPALRTALALATQIPQRWALPYETYYTLPRDETEVLLARAPSDPIQPPRRWMHRLSTAVSGCVVVPRAAFRRVRGFDERFRNWGGEDRAFVAALNLLWTDQIRVPGICLHLWHPEGLRFANPEWPANRELEQAYLNASTPEALWAVLDAR